MYAIIQTGGKQYKVSVGDEIFVEKLDVNADDEITIGEVVAVSADDASIKVGSAKVVKNGKAKKVVVFTYKPKKNAKRKKGHRQPYTKLQITAINA